MLAPPQKRGGVGSEYRYFRFTVKELNNSPIFLVGEIQLLNDDGINVALNKPAVANRIQYGSVHYVFDGIIPNQGTPINGHWNAWQVNYDAINSWISVDLESINNIVSLSMPISNNNNTYTTYAPKGFILEGSNDNSTWDLLLTVNNYTSAIWASSSSHIWNLN